MEADDPAVIEQHRVRTRSEDGRSAADRGQLVVVELGRGLLGGREAVCAVPIEPSFVEGHGETSPLVATTAAAPCRGCNRDIHLEVETDLSRHVHRPQVAIG